MKEIAPYTRDFVFVCPDDNCGYRVNGETAPDRCPACGTRNPVMAPGSRGPLDEFLRSDFVEVPGADCIMATIPVPQIVWRLVMGHLETPFLGDYLPVVSVSWKDCVEFLSRLNTLPEATATGFWPGTGTTVDPFRIRSGKRLRFGPAFTICSGTCGNGVPTVMRPGMCALAGAGAATRRDAWKRNAGRRIQGVVSSAFAFARRGMHDRAT